MALSGDDILRIIAGGETLEHEFKSDQGPLSSSDMYEEVVALANHEGGVLLIGVEDNGAITGARHRNGKPIEPNKMSAAVFGNTIPPLAVQTSVVELDEAVVVSVEVPMSETIACTASGVCKRRALGGDGRPASVPYPPIEHVARRVDVSKLDYSASCPPGARFEDLSPVEFARVRDLIQRLGGDGALGQLDDVELSKALRVVETRGADLVPNVAGLLMFGTDAAIERLVPAHEVRFQVLGSGSTVLVNEVFRGPVGKVLEQVGTQFTARNQEQEVPVGLLRVPIPDYSPEGFREALNNAVLHRDYSQLGAVYVQFQPDGLLITNPGGFPRGVTMSNILVHEPTPRNPRLAEVFRRVGLVEQSGRGVDRIYYGQLRYGRPLPQYGRTDENAVRVFLEGGDGSLEFTRLVFEEDQDGHLSLDQLIALNLLFQQRRADAVTVAAAMQKTVAQARSVLASLVERGLAEARGSRRSKEFMLSAALYRRLQSKAGYVRERGFDRIQQEQMILTYVREHGRIARAQAADLCGIQSEQAKRLLVRMTSEGLLVLRGEKRASHYILPLSESISE